MLPQPFPISLSCFKVVPSQLPSTLINTYALGIKIHWVLFGAAGITKFNAPAEFFTASTLFTSIMFGIFKRWKVLNRHLGLTINSGFFG